MLALLGGGELGGIQMSRLWRGGIRCIIPCTTHSNLYASRFINPVYVFPNWPTLQKITEVSNKLNTELNLSTMLSYWGGWKLIHIRPRIKHSHDPIQDRGRNPPRTYYSEGSQTARNPGVEHRIPHLSGSAEESCLGVGCITAYQMLLLSWSTWSAMRDRRPVGDARWLLASDPQSAFSTQEDSSRRLLLKNARFGPKLSPLGKSEKFKIILNRPVN